MAVGEPSRSRSTLAAGRMSSAPMLDGPFQSSPTFCSTKLMPMAEIKGATRGAFRSGR